MSSRWGEEFGSVEAAFARPTLSLLHKQWATPVLTVFRTAFTADRVSIPVPEFRLHVADVMETLRGDGREVPAQSASVLCATWVADGWLRAELDADLGGVYRLTASSVEALTMITNLSKHRLVSASRVGSILDEIREAADMASSDRGGRIERLNADIESATAERDRLLAGGEMRTATLDEMIQKHDYIAALVASLPADFRRVGEEFAAARRRLIDRMMSGEDAAGDMLSGALTDTRNAMRETASGRAFEGVVGLLRDDATVNDLRRNIEAIMSHEFALALSPAERRSFADVGSVFSGNVDTVLAEPRKLAGAMAGLMERHVARREINQGTADALRAARKALMAFPGRRITPGVLPVLPRLEANGLIQRLYDPDTAPPPVLLAGLQPSSASPMSLEQLKLWGGPHMTRLSDHITDLLATLEAPVTLGRVWTESPADLRRAVEIVGYLTWAVRDPRSVIDPRRHESLSSRLPTGETREWTVPHVTFHPILRPLQTGSHKHD